MECYFAHLPAGLLEVTSAKEPVIRLISLRHCPHYKRPCSKKSKEKPCCLGIDKICSHECCNDDKEIHREERCL